MPGEMTPLSHYEAAARAICAENGDDPDAGKSIRFGNMTPALWVGVARKLREQDQACKDPRRDKNE